MSDILQCLEAAGPAAADPGGITSAGPFMNAADAVCLCREAVTVWGVDTQINQCMEECAELVAARNRYRRGRCMAADVAGELADHRRPVWIVCRSPWPQVLCRGGKPLRQFV